MAKIFDGKAVREYNLDKIAEQVEKLKEKGILPTLAVIIVGSDPASRIYVNNKKAACERTGMKSLEFAEKLLYAEKVAVVPGDAFGASGEGFIRCSYAYSIEEIETALERIEKFVKTIL